MLLRKNEQIRLVLLRLVGQEDNFPFVCLLRSAVYQHCIYQRRTLASYKVRGGAGCLSKGPQTVLTRFFMKKVRWRPWRSPTQLL